MAAMLLAAFLFTSSAGAMAKEQSRVGLVNGIFQSGRIFAPLVRMLA